MPNKMLFPGQQESEKIYLVIRVHWLYFLGQLVLWFLFIVILFVLQYYLPIFFPQINDTPYINYYELFKSVYVIFLMLGLFMIWTIYYLNIQIVTDERIVDVSQDSIFSHTVSELSLSKIEDVTSEVRGVLGTIFSYGNVYVQTAGTIDRFEFKNVPRPDKLEKLILDLYQRESDEKPQTQ